MKLATHGHEVAQPIDALKDPLVLEFLDLPQSPRLVESKFEQALIDLKVGKLAQADLGQIQFYVNYYDRERRTEGGNPTLGLILCPDKNDAVVKYTLGKQQERNIFATRYQLHLPTEEELQRELQRELRRELRQLTPTASTPEATGRPFRTVASKSAPRVTQHDATTKKRRPK